MLTRKYNFHPLELLFSIIKVKSMQRPGTEDNTVFHEGRTFLVFDLNTHCGYSLLFISTRQNLAQN